MFYEIKLKVDKDNGKGEMKEVVEHFITYVGFLPRPKPTDWNNTTEIAM